MSFGGVSKTSFFKEEYIWRRLKWSADFRNKTIKIKLD